MHQWIGFAMVNRERTGLVPCLGRRRICKPGQTSCKTISEMFGHVVDLRIDHPTHTQSVSGLLHYSSSVIRLLCFWGKLGEVQQKRKTTVKSEQCTKSYVKANILKRARSCLISIKAGVNRHVLSRNVYEVLSPVFAAAEAPSCKHDPHTDFLHQLTPLSGLGETSLCCVYSRLT